MAIKFEIYRDGNRMSQFAPVGAMAIGPESVPISGEVSFKDGLLVVERGEDHPCGVSLMWDVGTLGAYEMETTRLPTRDKPYNLNVELARFRLMKIVQKQEDWNLFDFPRAEKFGEMRGVIEHSNIEPVAKAQLLEQVDAAGELIGDAKQASDDLKGMIALLNEFIKPGSKRGAPPVIDPLPVVQHAVTMQQRIVTGSMPISYRGPRELPQVRGGDGHVLGPDHPVDEADGEVQPGGVAQHVGEPARSGRDRLRGRLVEPLPDEGLDVGEHGGVDALLGHVLMVAPGLPLAKAMNSDAHA